MNAIETAKTLIRAQLGQDIGQAVKELQEESGLSYEGAWNLARARHADLFRNAERIEAEQWEPPKPPIYRFTDTAKNLASTRGFKVQARNPQADERELMLVMAGGEVADIELVAGDQQEKIERKTQQLLDATPGLHRKIAEHLVRDQHPGLDDEANEGDKLAAAQIEIKRRIKEMQAADPKKTFRQCWEALQRSNPELFQELP